MSYAEAMQWRRYIDRIGPLSQSFNLERGFALLAMMISRANGGKAEMSDFMTRYRRDATPEDVMKILSRSRKD